VIVCLVINVSLLTNIMSYMFSLPEWGSRNDTQTAADGSGLFRWEGLAEASP